MGAEVVQTQVQPQPARALTWRSISALLFAIAVIQPALIYNWLVNGLWGLAGSPGWMVILLWQALATIGGSRLTKEEVFVIRIFEWAGLMYMGYYFAYLLRGNYYVNSEIAQLFGLQAYVPYYYTPMGDAALRVLLNRTFFDTSWFLPVMVTMLAPALIALFANLILGFISYQMFAVREKLEFPVASWDARTMSAIAEREPSRTRIIMLAIIGGAMYALISQGMVQFVGLTIMPRVLWDFTSVLETVLPGAAFAYTSAVTDYLIGFILPVQVTAIQLAASAGLFIFGNYYVTVNDMWPPEVKWNPGWGFLSNYNKSTIYFWNSLTIGFGLVAAVLPLVVHYRDLIGSFRGLSSAFGGKGLFTGRNLFLLYVATAGSAIGILFAINPSFPIPILLLFAFGTSFVITMLQTQAAGVTSGFTVPYLRETLVYFSGYRGLDIWFIPPDFYVYQQGSNIAQQLKMGSMLGVPPREYLKAYLLIVTLGLVGSFVFVSLMWKVAAIPGWAYPYTINGWPVESMNFWRWQEWLWTGYLFRTNFMIAGAVLSAGVYLVSDLVFHYPVVGAVAMMGMLMPLSTALAWFGGSVGSYLIARFIGKERWGFMRGLVYIGFIVGDGLVGLLLQISTLVGKAIWLKPY